MSRARLFVENILVYGLGGMLAKLVPFAMLPVVTRLMPGTEYFGLSDLANTVVSFASAFAIMGMYDAMFRMFFEREEDDGHKRRVCSTALLFVTGSSLIVALCLILFRDPISRVFFGSAEFSILVVVAAASVFLGGNNSIIQAPTRMQNKRLVFIVMNLVTAVLSYSISIPLLLCGQYLLALPLAAALASLLSLLVFLALNRRWFDPRLFDTRALKAMLMIGLPLMPTFLFYWVFNSADRLMIVNLVGVGAAGVYAVAAKVGQVSQLIYTAFAQGWQYFAFSTMRDDDQVRLNSRIYEYLGIVSLLAAALLIVFVEPLFGIMFPGDYLEGVVAAPYLFLSPLLLMLYQVAGNQLLVVRKTWPSFFMLLGGAVVNIALNALLIPGLGIEGAAVATLCGYLATNAAALAILTRMGLLSVRPRFLAAAVAFACFFLLWRFLLLGRILALGGAFLAFAVALGALYRDDLGALRCRLARGKGSRADGGHEPKEEAS